MPDVPQRGEVWFADMNPVRGHEQAGRRPVLVVSHNRFNASAADLVVVLPITSRNRGIPLHVPISPPEGGLRVASVIQCDHIRSISKERLIKRFGAISERAMQEVESLLLRLMDLE